MYKDAKFSSHRFEVQHEYKPGQRVAFLGESEVRDVINRSTGKDGETSTTYALIPIVVELRGLEDGIYQESEITKTNKHSWIYMHRMKVRQYWEEQLSHKYPDFNVYWEAYKKRLDENIESKRGVY